MRDDLAAGATSGAGLRFRRRIVQQILAEELKCARNAIVLLRFQTEIAKHFHVELKNVLGIAPGIGCGIRLSSVRAIPSKRSVTLFIAETTTTTFAQEAASRTMPAAWSMRSAPRSELPPNLNARTGCSDPSERFANAEANAPLLFRSTLRSCCPPGS